MNIFKKQPTMGYVTIADGRDDDAVVPRVTPVSTTSRTNDDHGGKKTNGGRSPIIVVTFLLFVFGLSLYAGGPFDDGRLRRSGGNLVDGTAMSAVQASAEGKGEEYNLDSGDCVPASNTFKGFSKTTFWGYNDPFQTCYHLGRDKKRKDEANCCWTNSYNTQALIGEWYQCVPNGPYGANDWHASYDPHPVTCGLPCQNVHEDEHSL